MKTEKLKKPIYKIKSFIEPRLFVAPITKKLYIVPVWLEVPSDTTPDQIVHIKPEIEVETEVARVKASRGSTIYIITKYKNKLKCTCSGFSFRKSCKHVAQFTFTPKAIKK